MVAILEDMFRGIGSFVHELQLPWEICTAGNTLTCFLIVTDHVLISTPHVEVPIRPKYQSFHRNCIPWPKGRLLRNNVVVIFLIQLGSWTVPNLEIEDTWFGEGVNDAVQMAFSPTNQSASVTEIISWDDPIHNPEAERTLSVLTSKDFITATVSYPKGICIDIGMSWHVLWKIIP